MNGIKNMGKRVLCFIIALIMTVSPMTQFALPVLSANIDSYITLDGVEIDELFLADGEKLTVAAVCESEEALRYSWQICSPASPNRWISITGQTSDTLAVSCSLVESLAYNDAVYIRCAIIGDENHTTEPIVVYMTGAPVEEEPIGEDPIEEEPIEEESIEEEPIEEEPVDEEPVEEEPTEEEPTEEEPTEEEPTEEEPIVEETKTNGRYKVYTTRPSFSASPTADEPTADEPTADEPTADEPTADEPTADEPTADEPTADEPTADEPTADEPTADEPTADEPTADEPTADEPTADEPTADEPTADEPTADEPTADEPTADEPTADEPTADEPTADEASEDDEEEYVNHSIVINYLFDNNAIAFEPYGASVAHGSSFTEKVESPRVVGYDPYRRIDESYVDATIIEFNIDSVTEDVTINVIYRPALVEFSIHHHLQNLHNDDYSLSYDYITKGMALTGSIVDGELALTEQQLPGFKALSYEKLEVAADGSTVIEIRYDRNYYLVDFDMNGGYGTEPVYTRFGDDVGANTPIRHGYVFKGWELVTYNGHTPTEAQQSEFELVQGSTITVPAANLCYKAIWVTTQTTYTMVFWRENADDDGYTYWGHLEGLGALSGSLVDGRDLVSQVAGIEDEQYFTFNEGKTDKGVMVEGDGSTVVNAYYTRNYYKITIKSPGLCTIEENHTHTDACYDMVCGLGHIHTDECVPELECEIPYHTEHDNSCIICGEEVHVHSPECGCKITVHTHTKSCWQNVGQVQNNTPSGAPESAVDGQVYKRSWSNTRYIYIKGRWYRYTGTASSDVIVDPVCGTEEHTHDDICSCKIPEHSHGAGCYKDVIHTHTDSCYSYSCGETGHTHEESCKRLNCGITANHTHSSTCKRSSSTNVTKEIYRKYGQSIEDIWPITDDNGVSYINGERWKPSDSSYYTQVLVFLTKMPPDNFVLTYDNNTYDPYTMQYYLEALPDEEPPEGYDVVTYEQIKYVFDNEIKAKYNYVTKAEDFFDIVGFYQYKSNPAFSGTQIDINTADKTVKFYYKRITDHYLNFSNNGEILNDKQQYGIMYGARLEKYNFVPEYPSKLEPGAYTFAGWYMSPGCFDGTEVDWSTLRMPEGDLLLYAKWVPIQHKVRVWLDSSLTEQIGEEQIVDHGAFAHAPAEHITNGNYVFQGWFYKDTVNGEVVEKAFNFTGIPIMKDMDIYARWGSHVQVDYTVNYRLHGTDILIADTTKGSAIAGHNKTFEAKAGDDLYEGYKVGYYPLVNSHTITMSVDGNHEFTFDYVFVPNMPYKVRYVDAVTGKQLLPDKVVEDNTLSVVTETFVRVDKTMPDAYQKRLVLSADDTDEDGDGIYDDNVITFYYNSDEEHAYYKIVHYIHNISTNGYREYRSVESVGTIGETYTVSALELTGFAFNGALTVVDGVKTPISGNEVSATLDADGLLIELYYDRVEYEYTVKYLDGATDKEIYPEKKGTGLFGEQITENAVDLTSKGYTLSSDSVKTLNISANAANNVIEFLYLESIVSIKYHVVGPHGCGTLSRSSENVKAITGVPQGSIPTASKGYRFVGWYADPECTVEADASLIDSETLKLVPTKESTAIWGNNVEFFAKFVPKVTTLTVFKDGWSTLDSEQSFIFNLKGVAGTETETVDLTFTIIGNGKAVISGLPVGDYTVTELVDWAWRYGTDEGVKSITLDVDQSKNVITFTNTREDVNWLDGNSYVQNIFQ